MSDKKYKVIVSDRAKRMFGTHIRFMAQVNKDAAKTKKQELMEAMRECMIFDISQVQYAIVETTGKINFYQKSRYRNVENGDVGIQVPNCDPPCLLIKDGEINYPGLRRWNGDEAKLREIIKSMKLDIKDIFLLTDSTDKGIYTVLKSNDKYGTKPICKAEDK